MKLNNQDSVKILIIRFSSLGDIILLSPAFREAKKVFPKAEITFMTSKEFGSVHSQNPHLKKTYLLDRKNGITEIFAARKFIKEQKFDIVFDAHSSLRSILIRSAYKKSKNFSVPKRIIKRYLQIFLKKKLKSKIFINQSIRVLWTGKNGMAISHFYNFTEIKHYQFLTHIANNIEIV